MNWIKIKFVKSFVVIFFVLQPIKAISYLENYLQADFNASQFKKRIFYNLLQQIEKEENFSTCVVFGGDLNTFSAVEMLQKDMQKVTIVHQNIEAANECCGSYRKFLVIAHWHEETTLDLLQKLATVLHLKRQNKILVIKNVLEKHLNETQIINFFSLSYYFKLSNLVLIFKDFYKTRNLFQFKIFPDLRKKIINFKHNNSLIFPNKIKNLYGAALRTVPDQILPKTAAYIDHNGNVQVKGYVMKFLRLFSKYLNATLKFPLNITIGKPLDYRDIYNVTQRNLIDVPGSLFSCLSTRCSQLMSDIYEINQFCLMVPLERPFSFQVYMNTKTKRIYFRLYIIGRVLFSIVLVLSTKLWSLNHKVPYSVRITDILVNMQVVSGMFGGSFKLLRNPSKSLRFIYMSIFLFGLAVSIITCTRMQTFLTHPFSYRIHSLPDLVSHNLRVLITQVEYHYLLRYYKHPPETVALIYKTVSSAEEFYQLQSSFNTSYAYPVSSPLWFLFDALQNYRNKPIFRLTDICFPYSSMMAFLLPPNSLFMEKLNHLIGRARDMGLLAHWLKTSYIDLVNIGKIYIPQDRTVIKKSTLLVFKDFWYLWELLLQFYLFATVIFIGEIIFYRLWEGRRRF